MAEPRVPADREIDLSDPEQTKKAQLELPVTGKASTK